MKKTNKKTLGIIILILCVLLVAGSYSFYAYVGDYYHANTSASRATQSTSQVEVEFIDEHDAVVFKPQTIKAGMIFYPGAKVEYTAYAPLLHAFAENGILCILPSLRFNMAIFDQNAADNLRKLYPDVTKWYLSGHSMGGAFAAKYIAKHTDEYDGLILMAAYPTSDLSNTKLKVITIYGTEDKILNMNRYKDGLKLMPKDFHEIKIDGGNHAFFGNYGSQSGDGEPLITNDEQIQTTVDNVISLLEI